MPDVQSVSDVEKRIDVPAYVQGLIFDCDGTLVDSMPLHMQAWESVIRRAGGKWDFEYFFSKKGMPTKNIVALYNRDFGTNFDVDAIVSTKEKEFLQRDGALRPITAVIDVVERYHGVLPMAVASGSTRFMVDHQLAALDITKFFDVIISADDGFKPKPAPDIFLAAAKRINIDPALCQVFEDGDFGLDAARAAGMIATDIRPFE